MESREAAAIIPSRWYFRRARVQAPGGQLASLHQAMCANAGGTLASQGCSGGGRHHWLKRALANLTQVLCLLCHYNHSCKQTFHQPGISSSTVICHEGNLRGTDQWETCCQWHFSGEVCLYLLAMGKFIDKPNICRQYISRVPRHLKLLPQESSGLLLYAMRDIDVHTHPGTLLRVAAVLPLCALCVRVSG